MMLTIYKWWWSLERDEQNWFIGTGFLMLVVAGFSVGIVGALNLAVLQPLMHLGFGTAVFGMLGGLVSSIVRQM